jgi:hypothetical protein
MIWIFYYNLKMTKSKRPRDKNQLAKLIVGIATGKIKEKNLKKPC